MYDKPLGNQWGGHTWGRQSEQQKIVNDLPEAVKVVRLGGSRVPLATANECACGKEIDLRAVQSNDHFVVETNSGKEAHVTLDMLEKSTKNKVFLLPGLAMEANKRPRYPWVKMVEPSIPIGVAVFTLGASTVLIPDESINDVIRSILRGLGLLSFIPWLLLKWATRETHWSMSLTLVGTEQTPQLRATTPVSGRNLDSLSLSTKKEIRDGEGHQPQLLDQQHMELNITTPSRDLNHRTTNSYCSTPSTNSTQLQSLSHFGLLTSVDEDNPPKLGELSLRRDSSHSSSYRRSHSDRRRLSHISSKKYSKRKLSFRRESFDESNPNDPIYADIPLRYKVGCFYDMKEARRRWDLTVAWRKEENIDGILHEELIHDHFEKIKELYPHWLCGKGLQGHMVYYEKPGKVNMKELLNAGLTVEKMIRYYTFICEVVWRKMDLREDEGQLISVFDCEGIRFRDIWSEATKFMKGASSVVQSHYVERCARIYVVNIPSWFAKVWALVKPLLQRRTLDKVKIIKHINKLCEEMQNDVNPKFIPQEYGGEAVFGDGSAEQCRWHAPEELEYCRIVKSLGLEARNNQTTPANETKET